MTFNALSCLSRHHAYECMSVWLYRCITVSLYHCITVSLYNCITVSMYYCITESLNHFISVSLCYCITVSLYLHLHQGFHLRHRLCLEHQEFRRYHHRHPNGLGHRHRHHHLRQIFVFLLLSFTIAWNTVTLFTGIFAIFIVSKNTPLTLPSSSSVRTHP